MNYAALGGVQEMVERRDRETVFTGPQLPSPGQIGPGGVPVPAPVAAPQPTPSIQTVVETPWIPAYNGSWRDLPVVNAQGGATQTQIITPVQLPPSIAPSPGPSPTPTPAPQQTQAVTGPVYQAPTPLQAPSQGGGTQSATVTPAPSGESDQGWSIGKLAAVASIVALFLK